MITQGTSIDGNIKSQGDFRVEGNLKGDINTTGKIVVGKTGVINGSIMAEEVLILKGVLLEN